MESAPEGDATNKKPTCCIVIGMAGSGKTTLMHRLHSHLYKEDVNDSYLINLDPAVLEVCIFTRR
jgi:GPN-loop GTPase